MQIQGSTVLVTGANRGIGAEFVRQLQERGAQKIYATARNPESITADGVEKLGLDITDAAQVAALAELAGDVQLLINNAGIAFGQDAISGDVDQIRREFDTNVFGPLQVARALAPVLGANGGGAILNVNSALSWFAYPGSATYSASKAASWLITDGVRTELSGQGTQVTSLHMGLVDTDMASQWDGDKISPEAVVSAALDGIESGADEVLVDDTAKQLKGSVQLGPVERYAAVLGAAA